METKGHHYENSKLLYDAVKVGAMNVVFMYMIQKLYPNNFVFQAFVAGSLFHISMEMLEVRHWYLEAPSTE